MISRRLLISTCAFALTTTPALPQPIPQQKALSASTEVRGQNQEDVRPPRNMGAALRAWGLDRPTRNLQFTRGEVSENRAHLTGFVITKPDGTRATLDNLTIIRQTDSGPAQGTFTIKGEKLVEANGSRIGSFILNGVRGGSNLLSMFNPLTPDPAPRPRSAPNRNGSIIVDAITLNDLTHSLTDTGGTTTAHFAQVDISRARFNAENFSFGAATLISGEMDNRIFTAKMAQITFRDASRETFQALTTGTSQTSTPFDYLSFALKHLSFEGLSLAFKGQNSVAPPMTMASIDRFGIDNVDNGIIGQFAMAGVKFNGGVGDKAWEGGLERLSLESINMRFFAAVGEAFTQAVARTNSKPATITTPARHSTPAQKVLLKDLLKGGPLDSGVARFDMAGFKIGAGGYEFTIDQTGLSQSTNSDNIITKIDLIPTVMRLTGPQSATNKRDALGGFFSAFSAASMTLRLKGSAQFEPESDLMTISDYQIGIDEIGRITTQFSATGFGNMMSQISIDELLAAGGLTKPGIGASARTPKSELSQLLAIYRGVKINQARFEVLDTGGLNLAARMFPGRSRTGQLLSANSAEQIAAQRNAWAQSARASAGEKRGPILLRRAAIAAARWMENGGSFVVAVNPPSPLEISAMTDASPADSAQWGLDFSHVPDRPRPQP